MEKFIHRGEADLLAEFTILYPFEVIYKQLNLPKEDVATFQRIAVAQTDWAHAEIAIEAGRRLGALFQGSARQAPRRSRRRSHHAARARPRSRLASRCRRKCCSPSSAS